MSARGVSPLSVGLGVRLTPLGLRSMFQANLFSRRFNLKEEDGENGAYN